MEDYKIKGSHLRMIKKAVAGTGWEVKTREHAGCAYVEIVGGGELIANGIIGEYCYERTSEELLGQVMDGLACWASLYFQSQESQG